MKCRHINTVCLNEFEIIRKYRCHNCDAVVMCSCEEYFGTRFLHHQLNEARDAIGRERVAVTHGFQPGICRECRGLPSEAHPAAAIHGRTSKIKRYYWRELLQREIELFGEWALANNFDPLLASGADADCAREQASLKALEEIKSLHETTPKYTFKKENLYLNSSLSARWMSSTFAPTMSVTNRMPQPL